MDWAPHAVVPVLRTLTLRSDSREQRSKRRASCAWLLLAASALGLLRVQSIGFSMPAKDVDDVTAVSNRVQQLLNRRIGGDDIRFHIWKSKTASWDQQFMAQVELTCFEGNPKQLGTLCATLQEAKQAAAGAMRQLMNEGEEFVVKDAPDLVIGQEVSGKIKGKPNRRELQVRIGGNQTAFMSALECQGGFPHDLKRGAAVQARVLAIDGNKVYLTARSGDLARPQLEPPNMNVSMEPFADLPPDQWLEGQVSWWHSPHKVLVRVPPPNGGEAVDGMLAEWDMTPSFKEDMGYGSPVKVRVKALDLERRRMELSMTGPESPQESDPVLAPESEAAPEAAQEPANEDEVDPEP